MARPDKNEILAALRAHLAADLSAVSASQASTQQGATHSENRPENIKDMRSTEASYVARGLAQRVEELKAASAALSVLSARSFGEDEVISAGALVELTDAEGRESLYFVVPVGGGVRLTIGGVVVRTLTVSSPLGKDLVGRRVEEELELPGGKGRLLVSWVG